MPKRTKRATSKQRARSAAAKRGWATRRAKTKARSLAAKRGWATRRAKARPKRPPKARPPKRVRREAPADVEVISREPTEPAADYRAYPLPDREPADYLEAPDEEPDTSIYGDAIDVLDEIFGDPREEPEIEWLPTFDEVYDYIDALVDEYDLDAHELFELAFGYSDADAP